jgi:hypothetical protein
LKSQPLSDRRARRARAVHGDFVRWQCIACGHDETIPSVSLLVGLRLPAETLIIDLEPRSRCRQCDARG